MPDLRNKDFVKRDHAIAGIHNKEAEVCVVGSGAGGALAAWALVNRGIRVRLLETGPRFDPAQTASRLWALKETGGDVAGSDLPEKSGSYGVSSFSEEDFDGFFTVVLDVDAHRAGRHG